MGLFGEKQPCPICGGKVGALISFKLKDGTICNACAASSSIEVSKFNTMSVADIKERLVYRQENQLRLNTFSATDGVGNEIKIDDNSKTWILPKSKNFLALNVDVFNFSDIIDYELNEDGETITKGGLGSAVAGGLLLGGVGAIVGGNLGKKNKSVVNKMYIRISTNNRWVKHLTIDLLNVETKRNSFLYNNAKTTADKILSLLDYMAKQSNVTSTAVSPATSTADELLKLKALLDAGILSQSEFDAEKVKILNR